MTKLTISPKPEVGTLNSVADPRIPTDFTQIETWANGEIDSTNLKKEGIKEEDLEAAIQTKLGGSFVGLKVEEKAANFEGESAKLYVCTKALTATLPAATASRTVGILNRSAASETVTVSAKAGVKIGGQFLEAGELTIQLTYAQAVVLEADGTNWWLVAGEPRRRQIGGGLTYTEVATAREPATEYEASKVRPATVLFINAAASTTEIKVGTTSILPETLATNAALSFKVPASVKWQFASAGAAHSTYIIE